ncbi:MAG: hypothetical protein K9H14_06225 [Actinomycetia bacterium]|nr:hypothetical protein [Actinomycetes bacterium]
MAKRVFTITYMLVTGILMIIMWGFFLATGQVPELQTIPIQISLHLAAEFSTSLLLIIASLGLLRYRRWAPALAKISLGMLLYTLIVSPGYYAQLAQFALVAMFGVLFLLAVVSIVFLFSPEIFLKN